MHKNRVRSQTNMTWFTLLASVLVLFAGRLAPLQLPHSVDRAAISVQSQFENETPATIENGQQQLRVSSEIPNRISSQSLAQSLEKFLAILPGLTQAPQAHPFRFLEVLHPTFYSFLLSLQPRSRSPPFLPA